MMFSPFFFFPPAVICSFRPVSFSHSDCICDSPVHLLIIRFPRASKGVGLVLVPVHTSWSLLFVRCSVCCIVGRQL